MTPDKKPAPKPEAELTDADLDKVAGGAMPVDHTIPKRPAKDASSTPEGKKGFIEQEPL